ncbi:hypothetical protein ACOID8_32210, partial [Klebsiella pneumoniae]
SRRYAHFAITFWPTNQLPENQQAMRGCNGRDITVKQVALAFTRSLCFVHRISVTCLLGSLQSRCRVIYRPSFIM